MKNPCFNPSLPDINRMNECFVLCLIWTNLSKWQQKQVNIHLSFPADNKRQREVIPPERFLVSSSCCLRFCLLCAELIYQMITKMSETGNVYRGRLNLWEGFVLSRFTLAPMKVVMLNFSLEELKKHFRTRLLIHGTEGYTRQQTLC